jgi:NitT/TauT family transport system permease protein
MATQAVVPAVTSVPLKDKLKFFLRVSINSVSPLRTVNKTVATGIFASTIVVLLGAWLFSPWALLPTPAEVWHCFTDLWMNSGLGNQLIVSYVLNLQAIGVALIASLSISYLSVIPIFKPTAQMTTALRMLSMVGISLAFELTFDSKHTVKVAMLAFSISVWFITSMLDVIKNIPKEQFDLARTLRFSQWRIVWEVVILGTAAQAFDVLRQTAAMGWMMLTLVEGIVFAEGGVGTMLQTMQHHAKYGDIMAIQICILIIGIGQDYIFGFLKNMFFGYANLTVEN